MPPLLLAILISSFVFGVGTLSYSPPVMHSKTMKDQSRIPPGSPNWPHGFDAFPAHDIPKRKVKPIPVDLSLLARATKYLGTNPTGWSSVWCARFMAMIAPEVARKVRNPNLARSWVTLPKAKPVPGVIVVLARGRDQRAGHIGVVKGFDQHGNPRVISGNHNRKVGMAVYHKSRVLAYVSPS